MGTNSKYALLLMAVKTEYVFFQMAAPVTNGLITGESVVPQHKKAQHLLWLLKNKLPAVTCHQVLQKK